MRNVRLIARLDIKGPNLIKGIHLEGLRVIGSPQEHALKYYLQGADELIYMDCVASLYGRNHLGSIISRAARDIFVPMTVGGGSVRWRMPRIFCAQVPTRWRLIPLQLPTLD